MFRYRKGEQRENRQWKVSSFIKYMKMTPKRSWIHYMAKSMWVHLDIAPLCDCWKTCDSTELLKQPPLFWFHFPPDVEPGWRDFLLFSHKSIGEVHQWCWVIRSGPKLEVLFIPKVLDGVVVRVALCRQVKFFHIKLEKPQRQVHICLYGPGSVYGGIVMLNMLSQSWKHSIV